MFVHSRRAEGGLPLCAGIGAGKFQRVVLFSACVLKVRQIVAASLRSNRRTGTREVSFEVEHRRLRRKAQQNNRE